MDADHSLQGGCSAKNWKRQTIENDDGVLVPVDSWSFGPSCCCCCCCCGGGGGGGAGGGAGAGGGGGGAGAGAGAGGGGGSVSRREDAAEAIPHSKKEPYFLLHFFYTIFCNISYCRVGKETTQASQQASKEARLLSFERGHTFSGSHH